MCALSLTQLTRQAEQSLSTRVFPDIDLFAQFDGLSPLQPLPGRFYTAAARANGEIFGTPATLYVVAFQSNEGTSDSSGIKVESFRNRRQFWPRPKTSFAEVMFPLGTGFGNAWYEGAVQLQEIVPGNNNRGDAVTLGVPGDYDTWLANEGMTSRTTRAYFTQDPRNNWGDIHTIGDTRFITAKPCVQLAAFLALPHIKALDAICPLTEPRPVSQALAMSVPLWD